MRQGGFSYLRLVLTNTVGAENLGCGTSEEQRKREGEVVPALRPHIPAFTRREIHARHRALHIMPLGRPGKLHYTI